MGMEANMVAQWLDRLHDALRQRGLPPAYSRRFMDEITEHLTDLMEEMRSMSTEAQSVKTIEQRMGTQDELAIAAAREFRRSRFCGRHPWLAFIVAPAPLMIVVLILYFLPVLLSVSFIEGETTSSSPTMVSAFVWFCRAAAYVPAAIVALVLCHLAVRSGRGWRWFVPACLILSALAGSFSVSCRPPTTPGTGQLTMGFGIGPGVFHVLQALVPLGIAAAYLLWQRHQRSQPTTPGVSEPVHVRAAA
jgi:hypothetical protein